MNKKNQMIFDIENWLLKVRFRHFLLTHWKSVNVKSKKYFSKTDFWEKTTPSWPLLEYNTADTKYLFSILIVCHCTVYTSHRTALNAGTVLWNSPGNAKGSKLCFISCSRAVERYENRGGGGGRYNLPPSPSGRYRVNWSEKTWGEHCKPIPCNDYRDLPV